MRCLLAASVVATMTFVPLAASDSIQLFGQIYNVERIDYFNAFSFPNPNPAQLQDWPQVSLFEAESAHFFGNNRLLLGSEKMSVVTYKTICVEVELRFDPAGIAPTDINFSRVVFWQDPPLPPSAGFDLSPSGLTINTGSTGLGAGGNVIVTDTENQIAHAYDFTTGQRIAWAQTPSVPFTSPAWDGWSVRPNADEPEDVAYVPTRDRFYIVQEDENGTYGGYRIAIFETDGTFVSSFPVGGSATGGPKGLTFIEDTDTYPDAMRSRGGSLLLSWDDGGPGLEAFTLDGVQLAYEPLPSAAPLDPGAQALTIEAITTDYATGRIFLIQQGDVTDNNYLFILTPCRFAPDLDRDGDVDLSDLATLLSNFGASSGMDLADGDIDGDDDVDLSDLAALLAEFGATCP